jgi:hypothetical protein
MAAIKTLRDRPQRCPLAEESKQLQAEVRLLLYGKRNMTPDLLVLSAPRAYSQKESVAES